MSGAAERFRYEGDGKPGLRGRVGGVVALACGSGGVVVMAFGGLLGEGAAACCVQEGGKAGASYEGCGFEW